ncbi:metallo-beta-lactamase superfamily protein [Anaeramoeba ignava]|uniref:Metallo-beta-lactamase superfamily protein n=1 Tax=Anaeramoeba ignava TaxID=1746090 RepID=A0A9Q0LDC7_ANAIG|nr:metallo-beta-lactamase superfamily protein [Anaeramoeba ignava]
MNQEKSIALSIISNNSCGIGLPKFPNVFFIKNLNFQAEHGLSFLIEVLETPKKKNIDSIIKSKKIFTALFDTGGNTNTIFNNFPYFQRNYSDISRIVLSHGHYDHIGGLKQVVENIDKTNQKDLKIIAHPDSKNIKVIQYKMKGKCNDLIGKTLDEAEPDFQNGSFRKFDRIPLVERIESKTEPEVLYEDSDGIKIFTTGEVPRNNSYEIVPKRFLQFNDKTGKIEKDDILDDLSLVLETGKNKPAILVTGCCHAGIVNTYERAKTLTKSPIDVAIGGFHLVSADEDKLKFTSDYLFNKTELKAVFPIHCSGSQIFHEIEKLREKNNGKGLKAFNDNPVGLTFLF